jgi:hypothetical protein
MTRILNRKLIVPALRVENHGAELGADNLRVVNTNGTTAVNVFGAKGAPSNLTITGFFVIAKDTTAGNITLQKANGDDIAVVAKGTTAGALVGEDGALANTSVPAGDAVNVVSSSAGNAVCFITYTFDV